MRWPSARRPPAQRIARPPPINSTATGRSTDRSLRATAGSSRRTRKDVARRDEPSRRTSRTAEPCSRFMRSAECTARLEPARAPAGVITPAGLRAAGGGNSEGEAPLGSTSAGRQCRVRRRRSAGRPDGVRIGLVGARRGGRGTDRTTGSHWRPRNRPRRRRALQKPSGHCCHRACRTSRRSSCRTQTPAPSDAAMVGSQSSLRSSMHVNPGGHGKPAIPPHIPGSAQPG